MEVTVVRIACGPGRYLRPVVPAPWPELAHLDIAERASLFRRRSSYVKYPPRKLQSYGYTGPITPPLAAEDKPLVEASLTEAEVRGWGSQSFASFLAGCDRDLGECPGRART